MRSIPLLVIDATDVFDRIAKSKHQPRKRRMEAARSEVLTAYQCYENVAPNVGGLNKAPLTEHQKESMQHAYVVETAPMSDLRERLLKRTIVARCPFCGISETSTLDHYLPKEKYPEFSIFPKNLVPSCAVCNTHKRDRILLDGTDVRMFFHPCFDVIPNISFLNVSIRMMVDAVILNYRVTQPTGMSAQIFQHVKSHFDSLNLADRYRLMGLEHMGGQYPAFSRAYGTARDAKRVADKLAELADDFETVSGPNYWLTKLYRALAGNHQFCDGGFEVARPRPT